jgi:glycosyltransferase involved in cell wall biosynthesis
LRRHVECLAARNPNACLMHIPHGLFDPPELLASSGDLELLIFGMLSPFKGLELLLDVLRDFHRRSPSLRLTIAGAEHPRFPSYVSRVRHAFGEHPAIHWLGYVPEAKLRNVFARATIVVLPYLATTGSSSVVYRAAGWGRPIVASDLPELQAIAEGDRLWIEFFPSGDRASLAATLERLLADPALRVAQAQHNYDTVARHLTLAHTCQAYLRAFDLALATRKSDIRIPIPVQLTLEVI